MRLAKDQGNNVKVTLQPHPYRKGEKGVNKSFILYDCGTSEVLGFFMEALEAAGVEEEGDDEE
tara:strand:+ start:331 stop:519 length:189 start_codon:yes stop_codon:yes gene_type:complete